MSQKIQPTTRTPLVMLLVAALLSSSFAQAGKPEWAGGKHEKPGKPHEEHERHEHKEHGARFFDEGARSVVIEYYGAQVRMGHCPPGLAKKHNGCLPPGQAKKWAIGYPLPADIRFYELPYELVVRLPPPPPRHRYVRVAGDILLIAVGTSIVVDAIEDIIR